MVDEIGSEMRDELSKQYEDIEERTSPEDFLRMARDAVRYFYIMRKANAHLDFDLDLAKSQSMENPVYYIQYAHARICSIFKKYYSDTGEEEIDFTQFGEKEICFLKEEKELKIIKLLVRFPRLVEELANSLETHKLHEYLTEVASELQQYYTMHRVINPDNAPLTRSRFALIYAVRTVIRSALSLLGISAPESM
jgi:arginyl-tRNA synthetase